MMSSEPSTSCGAPNGLPIPRTLAWRSKRVFEAYWLAHRLRLVPGDRRPAVGRLRAGHPADLPEERVAGGSKAVVSAFVDCVCRSLPSCW